MEVLFPAMCALTSCDGGPKPMVGAAEVAGGSGQTHYSLWLCSACSVAASRPKRSKS